MLISEAFKALLLPYPLPGMWPHSLLWANPSRIFIIFPNPQIDFHFLVIPTAFRLCLTLSYLVLLIFVKLPQSFCQIP